MSCSRKASEQRLDPRRRLRRVAALGEHRKLAEQLLARGQLEEALEPRGGAAALVGRRRERLPLVGGGVGEVAVEGDDAGRGVAQHRDGEGARRQLDVPGRDVRPAEQVATALQRRPRVRGERDVAAAGDPPALAEPAPDRRRVLAAERQEGLGEAGPAGLAHVVEVDALEAAGELVAAAEPAVGAGARQRPEHAPGKRAAPCGAGERHSLHDPATKITMSMYRALVCVTTCRRAGYLRRYLPHLAAFCARDPRFSLLVSLDGPDEETLRFCEQWEIPLLHSERREGVGISKNRALESFPGFDYYFFLEDDVELIDGAVFPAHVELAQASEIHHFSLFSRRKLRAYTEHSTIAGRDVAHGESGSASFNFFTREGLERVGGWHPRFAEYRRWGHTEHSWRFVRAGLAPAPFNVASELTESCIWHIPPVGHPAGPAAGRRGPARRPRAGADRQRADARAARDDRPLQLQRRAAGAAAAAGGDARAGRALPAGRRRRAAPLPLRLPALALPRRRRGRRAARRRPARRGLAVAGEPDAALLGQDGAAAVSGAPLVSVLLPCFEAERFLAGALDSLLAQTHERLEVLALDDGSRDGTARILTEYAERDERMRVLASERNLGLIATLNRGVEASGGELIARMDADDLAAPQRIERQVELLARRPEIGVVGTAIEMVESESLRPVGPRPVRCTTPGGARFAALFTVPVTHPTILARACDHARPSLRDGRREPAHRGLRAVRADARGGRRLRQPRAAADAGALEPGRCLASATSGSRSRTSSPAPGATSSARSAPARRRARCGRWSTGSTARSAPRELRDGLRWLGRLEREFLAREPADAADVRRAADLQRVDVLVQAALRGRPATRLAAAGLAGREARRLLSPSARRYLAAKLRRRA